MARKDELYNVLSGWFAPDLEEMEAPYLARYKSLKDKGLLTPAQQKWDSIVAESLPDAEKNVIKEAANQLLEAIDNTIKTDPTAGLNEDIIKFYNKYYTKRDALSDSDLKKILVSGKESVRNWIVNYIYRTDAELAEAISNVAQDSDYKSGESALQPLYKSKSNAYRKGINNIKNAIDGGLGKYLSPAKRRMMSPIARDIYGAVEKQMKGKPVLRMQQILDVADGISGSVSAASAAQWKTMAKWMKNVKGTDQFKGALKSGTDMKNFINDIIDMAGADEKKAEDNMDTATNLMFLVNGLRLGLLNKTGEEMQIGNPLDGTSLDKTIFGTAFKATWKGAGKVIGLATRIGTRSLRRQKSKFNKDVENTTAENRERLKGFDESDTKNMQKNARVAELRYRWNAIRSGKIGFGEFRSWSPFKSYKKQEKEKFVTSGNNLEKIFQNSSYQAAA